MKNFEKRRDRYDLFRAFDNPLVNINFQLDVPDFRPWCKERNIPVFHFFLFCLLNTVREIDNFMLGGMALERLALLAPLRVRKLVAVAPVPSCGVSMDAAARALFLDASGNQQARRAIIDRSTGGRLPASWLDWKAQYSWESADPAAFARYFLAWSGTDFSEEIKAARVELPLLALVGEHDPRFDAALMRRTYLAWYPQARLEVLGNAGHYPMNETPLALAASIEAFLSAQ